MSVSFKKSSPLFANVNLAVRRGEAFVLVGSSGVGKSVLLKTIAGLVAPTSGQVLVEGELGMLFQRNALFDSLTVKENLTFPLKEKGKFSLGEVVRRAEKLLAEVGLENAADLFPDEISGGMQKRLGIARALILEPEIILYDDPTAGLDPITSKMIIELILKLKKEQGTTVVAVTNDMNRAFQMGDRLGMLIDKTLKILGTPDECRRIDDQRVRDFIEGRVVDVT